MTTRLLPREEWARLEHTELGPAIAYLNPHDTEILVVEDAAGAIVACWAAVRYVHVEGLWIAPAHRKRGRVGARLLDAMRRWLRVACDVDVVLTAAVTPDVQDLINKVGGRPLPGQHYAIPLGGLK